MVRLTAARESLGRHLAHEESEAIALIQRHIEVQEWERLHEEHFGPQQLPRRTVLALVPWVMHELPAAAQQRMLAGAPRALVLVWRLTRRHFAREERRTFRYAN